MKIGPVVTDVLNSISSARTRQLARNRARDQTFKTMDDNC